MWGIVLIAQYTSALAADISDGDNDDTAYDIELRLHMRGKIGH